MASVSVPVARMSARSRRSARSTRKIVARRPGPGRVPRHVAAHPHPRDRESRSTCRTPPRSSRSSWPRCGDLEFWRNVGRTMTAWALGLAHRHCARRRARRTIIGLVPFLRRATHTTVEFLRPIPSVALIPLAILLFGFQLQAALRDHRVRELLAGVRAGALRRRRRRHRRSGHRAQLRTQPVPRAFATSCCPTALPYIMTGVRLAAAVALILAVTAEIDDRQSRARSADRRTPARPATASTVYAIRRGDGAPRAAGQPRLPTHRAALAVVAPVGARGGGRCDPLHEHRRHSARPCPGLAEVSARASGSRSGCPSSCSSSGASGRRSRPPSSSPPR